MIFPQTTNPATSADCWDVGSKASLTHDGGGDTQAIAEMVKYTLTKYSANANRVYATGDSSGAMMTQALMAVYPDVFKGGASFAGVPAGCWSDGWTAASNWGGTCASGNDIMTAQAWGDLVRGMYPGYAGHRPRVQLFHGDADPTINFKNFGEAIKEWTNVLGLSTTPTTTTTGLTLGTHQATRQQWKDSCGYVVLDAFESIGGDHGPSDALFVSTYVVPFLGLDNTGAVDPEIAQCGSGGRRWRWDDRHDRPGQRGRHQRERGTGGKAGTSGGAARAALPGPPEPVARAAAWWPPAAAKPGWRWERWRRRRLVAGRRRWRWRSGQRRGRGHRRQRERWCGRPGRHHRKRGLFRGRRQRWLGFGRDRRSGTGNGEPTSRLVRAQVGSVVAAALRRNCVEPRATHGWLLRSVSCWRSSPDGGANGRRRPMTTINVNSRRFDGASWTGLLSSREGEASDPAERPRRARDDPGRHLLLRRPQRAGDVDSAGRAFSASHAGGQPATGLSVRRLRLQWEVRSRLLLQRQGRALLQRTGLPGGHVGVWL